jgi:hypothetical protein
MRGFMDEQGNVVYAEFQSGQYGKTWNYKVVDGKAQWGVAETAQPAYGGPGLTNFRSLSKHEVESSGLVSSQFINPEGKLLFEEGKSGVSIVEMDSYKQILQRRVDIGAEYPVFGHWDAKEFTNEESGAKQALKAIGAGRTAVDIATGAGNLAITGRRLGGVSGGGTGVAGPKEDHHPTGRRREWRTSRGSRMILLMHSRKAGSTLRERRALAVNRDSFASIGIFHQSGGVGRAVIVMPGDSGA